MAEHTSAPEGDCCRRCRQPTLEEWFEWQRSPRKISRLLTEADLTRDTPVRLTVSRCLSCDFVQAPFLDQRIDDDDHVLSWMQIETLRDYRTDLARVYSGRLVLVFSYGYFQEVVAEVQERFGYDADQFISTLDVLGGAVA